ncbi:type II toxin-antitoxin system PemK/MazF family toxin [Nocardioides marmorisolisilvae]|uniref:Type II toxin-antitoxin system PemK/MazF family toxin n=1 Tax=Nocardioides marmorisolisilvae TaxID=1542737 RepID=A0A3N0DU08_9ACTN|nr:type II toxin-antitoxin system PemK/MazF family toxin [Nocardioides marmorisolisilvae]RNL79117.1 type II toxin-antitoxin system PemK/MazF family toxin [Nocardioides marmorisolisilvae]
MAKPDYNPAVDGRPFPGEVVWTWVAYDQDSREGKDRPVLVLAVEGARVTALELRSRREHRPQRARQVWLELGVGDWDRNERESEVRVDRTLTVSIYDVRRVGAELDQRRFDEVVRARRRFQA